MQNLDEILKKLGEDLKKTSKETAEKLSVLSRKVAEDVVKVSNETVQKINEVTKKFSVDTTVSTTDTQKILDDFMKNIRFSRFKQIWQAIEETPKSKHILLKSLFLKGLLTHNKPLLEEIIRQIELIPYSSDLEMLGAFSKDKAHPLSPELLEFVQEMLANESEKVLLTILMNAFQSIPELSLDSKTGTLSMKTKKGLLPLLIAKVDTSIAKSIMSQLTDISFDSVLPAFRPSIGDPSYQKTNINLSKYLSLVGDKTDISEFLILTIGLFTSLKIGDKGFLQELSADYLFVRYDECLHKIIEKVKEKKVVEQLGEKQVQKIMEASGNLKLFDPRRNDPRRFFETRLAQYINGLSHSEETLEIELKEESVEPEDEVLRDSTLKACNKILQFFLGDCGRVDTPREMEQKICIFANGYKDASKFTKKEVEFITGVLHHAEAHKGRDRVERDKLTGIKERKFETDSEKVGSDVWNCGGGVMKGCSPVFYDAQREPMRNMLVDSSTVAPDNNEGKQWFWNNNRQYSSYVGSISGHTCNIVGMLAKYMAEYKKDPDLQSDINLFLTQVIGVYAKRGFHAMLEVIDVLHDPFVQDIFKEYGVQVNLYSYFKENLELAGFLHHAMNDATTYTQALVNKEHVKEALQSKSHPLLFSKKIEESGDKKNDHTPKDGNVYGC
ncbi:TPA: Dot/Icm T4SS effector Ceg14/sidL [Legionella pneumophila]